MKKLHILLIFLISAVLFLLFSDKANAWSKPYLASLIASQVNEVETVEILQYRLDYDHITLDAQVNKAIDIGIDGDLNLPSQLFDLNYSVKWAEQAVDVAGNAKGSIENILVTGLGDALASKVNYTLEINQQTPRNIQVDIHEGQVEKVLALTGQPDYAKGLFDLHIDMPKISQTEGIGEAKLTLNQIKPNVKLLKKDFEIDLPSTTVTGTLNSKLRGVVASIDGEIQSSLAKLYLQNGQINLETMAVVTGFILDIDELKKLQTLTKSDLNGKLKLEGKLQHDNQKLQLNMTTKSLGGTATLSMSDDQLTLDMQGVAIDKILPMIAQPVYLQGELDAKVALSCLKNLNGTVTLATHNAKTVTKTVNQAFNLKLQKPLAIQLNSEAAMEKDQIHATSTVKSQMFDLNVEKILYDLKASTLTADYQLTASDLSQLQELTNRVLRGSLVIDGSIKQAKTLQVTGKTQSLEGVIDFTLSDKDLHAKIDQVPLKNILNTLDYPQIFSAPLSGVLDYNLQTQKGRLNSELPNTKLISNQLTELVKQATQLDLTKEVYNQTDLNATINREMIYFVFAAKSKNNYITLTDAKLNRSTDKIDARYHVTIKKKDLEGQIKGDVRKPRVTIDSSQFLRNQIGDKIDSYIKKEGGTKIKDKLKDFGLDNNQSQKAIDKAKDLLKGLF